LSRPRLAAALGACDEPRALGLERSSTLPEQLHLAESRALEPLDQPRGRHLLERELEFPNLAAADDEALGV
jgi:hypothetical protein